MLELTGHQIPMQSAPFVGRSQELDELAHLLRDRSCQLLTLAGPGGSGKTRLAIEVARLAGDAYPDGIHFVSLQGIQSREVFLQTLADALGFKLLGQETLEQQILNALQGRELLIILDNMEQLLEVSEFIGQMLTSAPDVKALITSREVLNLFEEWRFPVGGMRLPRPGDHEPDRAEAVQLFIEYARRVQRDFDPKAQLAEIVRICQMVDGMPLAIELAASWVKVLTPAEIGNEIKRNIDFLRTNFRNIPVRHQSMRAVFEQTWKMLGDDEQAGFSRLAVFHGGFTRDAAEVVSGSTLNVLVGLVDKSLLHLDRDGRYQMHEMLRQYARTRLDEDPAEVRRVLDAHGDYFSNLLLRHKLALQRGNDPQIIRQLVREFENIRVAWDRFIAENRLEVLRSIIVCLVFLLEYQGRFVEVLDLLSNLLNHVRLQPESPLRQQVLVEALIWTGYDYIRVGRMDQARAALDESLEIIEQHGVEPQKWLASDPRLGLALVALVDGHFDQVIDQVGVAIPLYGAEDDQYNLTLAYYLMASAYLAIGAIDEAERHASLGHEVAVDLGAVWFAGYCLIVRGDVARVKGDYEAARRYFEASYEGRKYFDDPEGMAVSLNGMGRVAMLQADYDAAAAYFEEGLERYRHIGDRGGLARTLENLGIVWTQRGAADSAARYFSRALQAVLDPPLTTYLCSILAHAAELFRVAGQERVALDICLLVRSHQAVEAETLEQAQTVLDRLAEVGISSQGEAPQQSVEALSREIVTKLDAIETASDITTQPVGENSIMPEKLAVSPLVDKLSPREIEILRLIVSGKTNEEIAEELVLAVGTVKAHNHRIFSKLGVRNRVEASSRARELDLL